MLLMLRKFFSLTIKLTNGNIKWAKLSDQLKDGDSKTAAGSAKTSFKYSENLQCNIRPLLSEIWEYMSVNISNR